MKQDETPLVAICVATYKRPEYLAGLLGSMIHMRLAGFRAHILVVDNDAGESALPVTKCWADKLPAPLSYVSEPRQGIATARNRLVAEAVNLGADFVSFVDDDQFVEPNWLEELVKVVSSCPVDAVAGRWTPHFEAGVQDWARNSGYWDRAQLPTGTITRNFGTGNVLIRIESMTEVPGPFDEERNLTGGSDVRFFEQFHALGYRSAWCNESLVHERIPPTRATVRWMIRRGYRVGFGHGANVRLINPSLSTVSLRAIKSLVLIATSLLATIPALRHGKARIIPRLADVARGIGGLSGLVGLGASFEEYQKVHGR